MTLQVSASLQRCHSNFWLHLSDGYKKLEAVVMRPLSPAQLGGSVACHEVCSAHQSPPLSSSSQDCSCNAENDLPVSSCCRLKCEAASLSSNFPAIECLGHTTESSASPGNLEVILTQTLQLFRPYFSWREKVAGNVTDSDCNEDGCAVPSEGSMGSECKFQNGASHHVACAPTRELEADISTALDSASGCSRDCIFFNALVFQNPTLYSRTLLNCCPPDQHIQLSSGNGNKLVPHLTLPLCIAHSPFVMLIRRALSPKELVCTIKELHGMSQRTFAHQLLSSVYAMAACSCLVWAR